MENGRKGVKKGENESECVDRETIRKGGRKRNRGERRKWREEVRGRGKRGHEEGGKGGREARCVIFLALWWNICNILALILHDVELRVQSTFSGTRLV